MVGGPHVARGPEVAQACTRVSADYSLQELKEFSEGITSAWATGSGFDPTGLYEYQGARVTSQLVTDPITRPLGVQSLI